MDPYHVAAEGLTEEGKSGNDCHIRRLPGVHMRHTGL
eukprot:CAMPEP_0174361952 /NCGR_PEP_ID=MMETSP0811_2-20130205/61857_1 /TAXON_ID=73025 ORGANISM="Eutreptiella gymnastica-like, Strain CCMP1594" /NCGR_SAMPLE_ID=MMETSP0811_2 /ASSEMBLY_ACC=CAM_ASM_000667 /LENGTH=36 /DNA_ID= /DNA_START= /DNA_END= /DNA_ORIENTATION=